MKIMYLLKGLLIIICSIIFSINSSAQTQPQDTTTNVDDMFQKARTLAFNGKRAEARKICYEILKTHPDYYDVRVLIGRTFAWDDKPDSARMELKKVINKEYYEDAYSAMADVETWENRPDSALVYINELLKRNPNSVNYLLKKARLLIKKGDEKGAIEILKQILDNIEPANKEAKDLLASLKFAKMLNRVAVGLANEYFDESNWSNANWQRNWNIYSVEYSHRFIPLGQMQFRTNLGTLNGDATINKQFALDAYPGITKRDYLYLGYAYSPDDKNFPRHYFGAEIFHSFPKAFEGSLGFRYLYFGSDVVIYTGSVGKYLGNYWFNLRAYVTPSRDMKNLTDNLNQQFSKSLYFTVRRYFATSNDYLALTFGGGSSPVRYTFVDNFFISKKQAVSIGYQKVINRIFLGASIGLFHEQYDVPNVYRYELDTSLKIGYYF